MKCVEKQISEQQKFEKKKIDEDEQKKIRN